MNQKDPVKVCGKSLSNDIQENRDWTKSRLDHINRKILPLKMSAYFFPVI